MNALRNVASVVLLAILILFGVSIFGAVSAQAPQCGPYAGVLEGLATKYGETIVWQGNRLPTGHQVITAAGNGGTWTALIVQGTDACIATFGATWDGVARPAGEDI